MEIIATIGWALVIVSMLTFFIYVIVKTIKTRKQQKKYLPYMEIGDSVWFSTPATDINSVVEEIDGDFVKVSLIVRKDRLHLNNKN